jgi:uncharacterized protein
VILGLDGWVLATVAAGAFLGATLQGIVGIGLNLVAAPVVTLVAPQLMPVVPLFWAVTYPVGTLVREWRHADWGSLWWAVGGRVPGTVVGVLVVAWASDRFLGVVVGVMVLLAVLLTWRAVRVPVNRRSLGTAGFIGGVTGTATSIGGPPLALVYQHRPGPEIRASMAAYFCLGGVVSLVGLGVGGQMTMHDLLAALLLAPALLLGHAVSGPLRGHLDAGHTRIAVLVICGLSAVALLVRSALGS